MKSTTCLLLVLVLILSLLGLGTGFRERDPQRDLDRATSRIESALDAIEDIQTAEDLEEAQDFAADAEQDLGDAISILEDVEIPNWLWVPGEGALYFRGPIIDEETEQPVLSDVYANGNLLASGVTEVGVLMWETEHDPIYLRVQAPGYEVWELQFRFHLSELEVMKGIVRLKPKEGG